MKRKCLISFISAFFVIGSLYTLNAQQLPLFTQYREVQGLINPASVNHDYFLEKYNISAGVTYRSQWTGVPGNPVTTAGRAEYIIVPRQGNFHLLTGLYYLQDKTGLRNRQSAYARLGTIFSKNPAYNGLGIGLNAGAVWHSIDFTRARVTDPNDINFLEERSNQPDVGLGLYYYQTIRKGKLQGDQFYIGVSMPQMLNQDYAIESAGGTFKVYNSPHFYAHAGYYKTFSETMYLAGSLWYKHASGGLRPSAFSLANGADVIDFNARVYLMNKFWFGAGISTGGSVHTEVGTIVGNYMNLKNFNFKIGYAADLINTSPLARNFGMTHEINLVFYFDTENKI